MCNTYTHTYVYTHTHTHTLTHTTEYYTSLKKDETLSFVTTWIELKVIMLSEISQNEKHRHHMMSVICGI